MDGHCVGDSAWSRAHISRSATRNMGPAGWGVVDSMICADRSGSQKATESRYSAELPLTFSVCTAGDSPQYDTQRNAPNGASGAGLSGRCPLRAGEPPVARRPAGCGDRSLQRMPSAAARLLDVQAPGVVARRQRARQISTRGATRRRASRARVNARTASWCDRSGTARSPAARLATHRS